MFRCIGSFLPAFDVLCSCSHHTSVEATLLVQSVNYPRLGIGEIGGLHLTILPLFYHTLPKVNKNTRRNDECFYLQR